MIQTIFRAVKKYSQIEGHRDWDDIAERLALAINTSYDSTRHETPFYLVHGWDARTTLQASLPTLKDAEAKTAWRWRMELQRDYQYCLDMAHEVVALAQQRRAANHNATVKVPTTPRIREGELVWMYIDQVKDGVKKKLSHLWHGPFRVIKKVDAYSSILKLDTLMPTKFRTSKRYRFHQRIHDARLLPVRLHATRPGYTLDNVPPPQFDVDVCLPSNSFETPTDDLLRLPITAVHDVRWGTRAFGDRVKEYDVTFSNGTRRWEASYFLPPSPLLYQFDRDRLNLLRFGDMQETMIPTVLDPPGASATPIDKALLPDPSIEPHNELAGDTNIATSVPEVVESSAASPAPVTSAVPPVKRPVGRPRKHPLPTPKPFPPLGINVLLPPVPVTTRPIISSLRDLWVESNHRFLSDDEVLALTHPGSLNPLPSANLPAVDTVAATIVEEITV